MDLATLAASVISILTPYVTKGVEWRVSRFTPSALQRQDQPRGPAGSDGAGIEGVFPW
jgi:hypothetical protein